MRNSWKEYFVFNKRERRGVLLLTGINLLVLVLLSFKPVLFSETIYPKTKAERIERQFPFLKRSIYSEAPGKNNERKYFQKRQSPLVLELNAADSSQLVGLRGIGPSFAKRIIKYRERLGGFYSSLQLLEVYGMDAVRYQQLLTQIKIDISKVRGLNINTLPIDSLRIHPYFRWNLANLIVSYRQKHGPFSKTEDLLKLDLVNDSVYAKIAPYCRVQ